MDFNDLYYFYLIAEHSGFTRAEKVSGITKSLLSRRVAHLEDRLKVRLIQRSTRSFALTEAGRLLYGHAAEMVKEGNAAYDSLSNHVTQPSGVIRISSPSVLAQYHLAPILPGFMSAFPLVQVYLDATDRPVQVIEERIDLALRAHRLIDNEPGLIVRTLATSHLKLVASPAFIAREGLPETLEQLTSMSTISSVMDREEGELKWELENAQRQVVTIKHRPVLFCLNPRVQLEAVIQGIGIGLIPKSISNQAVSEGKLVHVLPEWSTHNHIIHAVFPSRKHMNRAVRAFLDYLVEHLPETLEYKL
ncbi:LysR family transcriptional regulator [Buttiauxella sp. WJP83]|uniref:LysR family transcriptional regulator n=1 Tax=Buttiauxella sp. WJP83 TaxID=2986951 RepID=UPI0022DD9C3F|nr:LysR family transcriptional regulator [Buttiauxella sp. WJP83]WBM72600.1 LysR family transcriptional regulator [Buttiauxella sp. WJP83]